MQPKVFISYSWSGSDHQSFVKECAERLISDGVDVVLDVFDLKEGDDKYAFMESMVTDSSVTHVLIMCDKKYSEKADERRAGVGTESQIISKHVYEKVEQSKFIPIICERDDEGRACTPTFLHSRISVDFSSAERTNENWERLIRLLFGKPEHTKPALGKPPAYITDDAPISISGISAKFNTLKQAILQEKKRISPLRRDFIAECIKHANELRVRTFKETSGDEVVSDLRQLKPVRNFLTDWILLESDFTAPDEMGESIVKLFEQLLELKSRPKELSTWNEELFQAQAVFVYEVFLYAIAALLRNNAFTVIHEIFSSVYMTPETERYGRDLFSDFSAFYGYSSALQVLSVDGRKLHSPAAAYINLHADREDINFKSLMEADLLVLMMSFVKDIRWFPQTLYYCGYNEKFEFFQKAQLFKYYKNLAIVTGHEDPDELKKLIKQGYEKAGTHQWYNFHSINFLSLFNWSNLGGQ